MARQSSRTIRLGRNQGVPYRGLQSSGGDSYGYEESRRLEFRSKWLHAKKVRLDLEFLAHGLLYLQTKVLVRRNALLGNILIQLFLFPVH